MTTERQSETFKGMVIDRYWMEGDLLPEKYEDRIVPPKGYRQRIVNAIVMGPENVDEQEHSELYHILRAFKGYKPDQMSFEQLRRSYTILKVSPAHHKLYMHMRMNPHHDINDAAKYLEIQSTTAKYQSFDLLRVRAFVFKDGKLKAVAGVNITPDAKRGRTCELTPATVAE